MVSRQRLDQPGAVTGIARRLRSAERGANLGYSSITRGGMRVASADGLRVETVAGGLPGLRVTGLELVDGTLRVTGTLEGSGTWSWTGPWTLAGNGTISGNVTATGVLTQNGAWNLVGNGKILGSVDISGILSVIAGGLIKVGAMTIDPADGGKITFPGGAQLRADVGDGIQLQIGNVKISAQAGAITLSVGTRSIGINSSNIRAALPTAPIANWPGRAVGDVVSNSTGDLFRIVN